MTQTLISNYTQPRTAMVVQHPVLGVTRLHYVPMTTVDMAREEFGPTLADAVAFVEGTCCTECGMSAEESRVDGRECRGCGIQACACLVTEDPHTTDVFWCGGRNGCQPVCGGYCCND
jgi:hypothetical protein